MVICALQASPAQADQAVVQGQIVTSNTGATAPGLTVSLIHPELGRSAPAISDGNGVFRFFGIPVRQTQYFLEVYWGIDLIHRSPVLVNTPRIDPPKLQI